MRLFDWLFRSSKESEDAALDRLHEKTLRELGMSEEFIPDEVAKQRRQREQNRIATANWPRDKDGNFI